MSTGVPGDIGLHMGRERSPIGPLVQGLGPAGFRVDGTSYRAVLLTPERAQAWDPPAVLDLDVLDTLLALDPVPEFILLGTGPKLVRPAPALVAALEARGLGVEVMDSRAAARAWGVLRSEDRRIVAALMPA